MSYRRAAKQRYVQKTRLRPSLSPTWLSRGKSLVKLQDAGINSEGVSVPVIAVHSRVNQHRAQEILDQYAQAGFLNVKRVGRFKHYRIRPFGDHVAKLWVRTAKSLMVGKGIPPGTPYYKNIYGEPIVKPEPMVNYPMDPTTSFVTAGFYLFGPNWVNVYQEIEVPDKRGKMKKLPSHLGKGYETLKSAYGT